MLRSGNRGDCRREAGLSQRGEPFVRPRGSGGGSAHARRREGDTCWVALVTRRGRFKFAKEDLVKRDVHASERNPLSPSSDPLTPCPSPACGRGEMFLGGCLEKGLALVRRADGRI